MDFVVQLRILQQSIESLDLVSAGSFFLLT
jgi:hypothetical protein